MERVAERVAVEVWPEWSAQEEPSAAERGSACITFFLVGGAFFLAGAFLAGFFFGGAFFAGFFLAIFFFGAGFLAGFLAGTFFFAMLFVRRQLPTQRALKSAPCHTHGSPA